MQRYFVYSDKDVSLNVRASRYDADGEELTNTWEIDLGLGLEKSAPDMSAFSPDGAFLAAAGNGGAIIIRIKS